MNGIVTTAAEAVGNPLYRLMPDHLPALVAAGAVPIVAFVTRLRARSGEQVAASWLARYHALSLPHRLLVWLLATTAAVHVGLCFTGHHPWLVPAFLAQAAGALLAARRLLLGRRWRRLATVVLAGSIVAYLVSALSLEAPDQVGMATKLVEIAALAITLTPARRTRLRRAAATAATMLAVAVVGVGGWLGAITAHERADGEGVEAHHGQVPMLASLVSPVPDREPTRAERLAARSFVRKALRAIAPYRDPRVAARAGYEVGTIRGTDHHAGSPRFAKDGVIFDPTKPESLVYAETSRGPLLLGAVWEMPGIGQRGPAIGGPLTHWHGHEGVCFGLAPPTMASLVTPFGGCPALSIAIPRTAEMIHLWAVPGAWGTFAEIDDRLKALAIKAFESGTAGAPD